MGQGLSAHDGERPARLAPSNIPDTSNNTGNRVQKSSPINLVHPYSSNEHTDYNMSPGNSPYTHYNRPDLQRRTSKPSPNAMTVPTVFRWAHGGHNVYITGTFNGWKERIPLNRSNEEFTTIIDLEPGSHQYKFIVDDEWKCNPDQPSLPDRSGAINNIVEVTGTDAFDFENFISTRECTAMQVSPPGCYDNQFPKLDPGTKPPPVLPPHLMQVLLNEEPISDTDPSLLSVPNHVMLNHLYALSISDGVMVLGVTNRYQNKYTTTMLYRPVFDDNCE